MKYTKKDKTRSEASHKCVPNEGDLNRMANQLDELARDKLKNGCLNGCLSGQEDDIRQDSILLALKWYMRWSAGLPLEISKSDWNTSKALAWAMRFTKQQYARKLSTLAGREKPYSDEDIEICSHPADTAVCEWPESWVREMIGQGIAKAAKVGTISQGNATVAQVVYCGGESAAQVAKRLGVHRSAVNQQLDRVRKAIRPLMEEIEVPFHT